MISVHTGTKVVPSIVDIVLPLSTFQSIFTRYRDFIEPVLAIVVDDR